MSCPCCTIYGPASHSHDEESDITLSSATFDGSFHELQDAARIISLKIKVELQKGRIAELEAALRSLISGIESWEDAVAKIIGRVPGVEWGDLAKARALLNSSAKPEGER